MDCRWCGSSLGVALSALAAGGCFSPEPSDSGTESASDASGSSGTSPGSLSQTGEGSGTSLGSQSGSEGDTTQGPSSATDTGPGTASATDTGPGDSDSGSTGVPACDPIGPAGLPGENPGVIWIANSAQSTISKVDTTTLTEVGRYITRMDNAGSPSRTSVSLDGDVAVANRNGGLTKYFGDTADCPDLNGNGVTDTSSGPLDVLAWDVEECRAWHIPMLYTSQRPVAWTTGTLNESTCEQDGEFVWTAGVINDTTIEVVLVDGDAGVIADSVLIPEIAPNFYGLYGGAVDAEGDFWASQLGVGQLVHVDRETMAYEIWPMVTSGYGMTVDTNGYVYTCSNVVGRFDPVMESWTTLAAAGGGGCAVDGQGMLWLANDPMVAVDTASFTVAGTIDLPEYVHGIGVAFDGNVWGISLGANAYRVDPATGLFDTVSGFVQAYTYSDMTGFALASVAP